jgi:hypothetical protein
MLAANRLVLLVEEPSMEAFLQGLLPRVMPSGRAFEIHAFQGKGDLLAKLEARLKAYARGCPPASPGAAVCGSLMPLPVEPGRLSNESCGVTATARPASPRSRQRVPSAGMSTLPAAVRPVFGLSMQP